MKDIPRSEQSSREAIRQSELHLFRGSGLWTLAQRAHNEVQALIDRGPLVIGSSRHSYGPALYAVS